MRSLFLIVARCFRFCGWLLVAGLLASRVYGQMIPPVISAQPQSQTVLIGSNATFSVTATGADPLNYVWFVNGSPVASGTDNTYTVTTAQTFNEAQYQVGILGADGGYTVSSVATLTVITQAVNLIDVDLGVGTVSPKTGPAAVGITATDFWNFYTRDDGSGGYRSYGEVPNLKLTDGTPTGALLQVYNAPGAWNNGVADPMYGTYVYSLSPAGATVTLVLTNLPAGTFDFFIYGHEPNDNAISSYELLVDSTGYGVKNSVGPGWNTNVWHEGVHYVPYRGVQIGSGQTVTIYVRPGNSATSPYGVISGLQIAQMQGPSIFPTAVLNGSTNRFGAVGSNVVISATVIGAAPLTNQWFFDGTHLVDDARISGSTTASLTISSVSTNDAGDYWLSASNANGSATTATATLNVGSAPNITLQPQSQTVTNGNSLTFNSDGDGSQPLGYQWYLGSTALTDDVHRTGSTGPLLSLNGVNGFDAGSYTMVLSNAFGMSTSAVATLTVLMPPSVSGQPIGRSMPAGLPTVFSASVNGTQPISYQWQLNGVDVAGATTITYTVTNVSAANTGTYTLVATNSVGSTTSRGAVLTIGPVVGWGDNANNQCLPPPGLTNVVAIAASQNGSYALGTDGKLIRWGNGTNVNTSATNLVAFSMSWNDAGIALRSDGTVAGINRSVLPTWTNIVGVAAGSTYLYILRSDGTVGASGPNLPAGLNNVVALSASGSQTMALRNDGTVLVWADAGSIITPPVPLTNIVAIECGFNCSFAVKADGHIIAWGNNVLTNVPAAATNVVAVTVDDLTSSSPGIAAALRSDGTVVSWGIPLSPTNIVAPSAISNAVAIHTSAFHALALVNNGAPQLIRAPVGGTAYSGNNFILSAVAAGPNLNYQWSHDGVTIANGTNANLVLANVQTVDAGSYQLTVTNGFGSVTSLAVPVKVTYQPPFVTIFPTGQTGYVGGQATLGVPISGSRPMGIQWRFHPIPSIGVFTNIPGATNELLTFNPLYVTNGGSYSVVATNAFGTFTSSLIPLAVRQVVAWGDSTYLKTNIPTSLTNAVAVANGGQLGSLALRDDGSVLTWNPNGTSNAPVWLTNITEVGDADYTGRFCALRRDGTVTGYNLGTGWSNSLATLSNIVAIESDTGGSTCLKFDGSVVRISTTGATNFPNVSNVVALASFDDGFQALRANGTVFSANSGAVPPTVTNVVSMACSRYAGSFLKRDQTIVTYGFPTTMLPSRTNNIFAIAASVAGSGATIGVDGSVNAWAGAGTSSNIPPGLPKMRIVNGAYMGFIAICTQNDFDPIFLHTALNTTNLVVSSRNSAQWYAQHYVTHDGVTAVRSAPIGRNTASSMRTLMTNGPAQVSFWWKVSSETNHDFLSFSIGGVPQASISGEVDWQRAVFNVPAGPQMLVWTYSKDASGTAGLDAGFVDELGTGPQPPFIYAQPQSQTVLGGSTANFSVGAYGSEPLTYRWFRGPNDPYGKGPWTNITGVTNVHRINSGMTFYVVVSNSVGTVTSSNAVLTVHTPQEIGTPQLQPDGTFLITSRDEDNTYFSSQYGIAGFHAQYSTNLIDWLPVNAQLSVSNGYVQFNDTDATNEPMRFYRIIERW